MKLLKRTRKTIIICLICICITIGMIPGEVSAITHTETYLDTYAQFLADYYINNSSLDFYLENSAPYHEYVTDTEKDFEETLATWRLSTMGVGDLASYSQKEVDFYILLIYDVIYQKEYQKSSIQNFNTYADAMMASVLLDFADDTGEDLVKLMPELDITAENWESTLYTIVNTETFSELLSLSDTLLKCIDYVGTFDDLVDKLSMLMEFIHCSEEIEIVLEDMYNAANDDLLKEAIKKVQLMTTGLLTETEIVSIFSGEIVMTEISSVVLNKIWDIATTDNAVTAGIELGAKVGKLAINFIFGLDETIEAWYSMEKVYTFEKVLKEQVQTYMQQFKADPTFENAIVFNQAADMYLNTLSVGMEYAIQYAENVRDGGVRGIIHKFFKNFTNKDEKNEYDKVIDLLQTIKNEIDQSIKFLNNETYNMYLSNLDSLIETPITWTETPCDVSEEELDSGIQEINNYLFSLTDQTIEGNTSYSEDKLTYADYCLNSGTLDLAGKTLTVYGDFYLNGGTLNISGGTLDIRGDMYVTGTMNIIGGTVNVGGNLYQPSGTIDVGKGTLNISGNYELTDKATNSAGEVTWAEGYGELHMNYAEDKVSIGGGFYLYSSHADDSNFSAGTLTIAGDFWHYGSSYYWKCEFHAGENHKIVLNGSDVQRVHMDTSSNFGILEIANNAGIIVENYFAASSLTSTLDTVNIQSDGMIINSLDVNVPTVNIIGDVTVYYLSLLRNTLSIDGNLYQPSGIIDIGKGTLNISGNYELTDKATNSAGEVTWAEGYGELHMNYAEDKVSIGGGFYLYSSHADDSNFSAGTLTIAGDFWHYGSSYYWKCEFHAGENHKVVLNGSDVQRVHMDTSSNFGILEIANNAGIIVDEYFAVQSLKSTTNSVNIQSNGMIIQSLTVDVPEVSIVGDVTVQGDVSLMKNKMHIDGNLYQTNGTITIGKGTLNISGNYELASKTTNSAGEVKWAEGYGILKMLYAEDRINVGGSFYMYSYRSSSPYNSFDNGIMTVSGDFYQFGNEYSNKFQGSSNHKVILNGKDVQSIRIDNDSSTFGILEIANNAGIIVDGNFAVQSLKSTTNSVNIQSNGMIIRSLTVDAPEVNILGDVTVQGDISLMKNTMHIEGTLIHTNGNFKIMKGTLSVSKDYRIQAKSIDEFGDTVWSGSSGLLSMTYDEGRVIIEGGFYTLSSMSHGNSLTAGTMCIAGDFYQGTTSSSNSKYNFNASGSHHVVLNGTAPQSITFESTESYFNYLHLTQSKEQYVFSRDVCWNHYHSDVISETVKPTCTEQGYQSSTCQYCGTVYKDQFVDAIGHTDSPAVKENEIPATNGKDGSYDSVIYCSVCGDEISREKVTVSTTDKPTTLLGDINLDGVVDVNDSLHLFMHSMLPEMYPISYAGDIDFTGDGSIDIMDSLRLFYYSMLPDMYPLG